MQIKKLMLRTGILILLLFLLNSFFAVAQEDTAQRPRTYTNLTAAINDGDHVKILKLSKKKLKNIPPEVFQLKNLEVLDLSNNKIKIVPAEIEKLSKLREINLSKNKIQKLPAEFFNLTKLEKISINRNPIDSLPDEISKLENLHFLDMWSTELAILPESIKKLDNLKIVELRGILFNQEQQDYMHSLLPDATINFSPACQCKF